MTPAPPDCGRLEAGGAFRCLKIGVQSQCTELTSNTQPVMTGDTAAFPGEKNKAGRGGGGPHNLFPNKP